MDEAAAADLIAEVIAAESGRPVTEFRTYAARLVTTLSRLSPEAQQRVLESHASRLGIGDTTTGSATGPDGVSGGSPDPNGTTPPSGDPGTTSDPAADPSPEDTAVLDKLNIDPPLSHSEKRDVLIAASPLSSYILSEVVTLTADQLSSSDMRQVLLENVPLPAEVYAPVVGHATILSESDRLEVVNAQQAATASTLAR